MCSSSSLLGVMLYVQKKQRMAKLCCQRMESHCPTRDAPDRQWICPCAGNPALQPPAPCPHTVLFPLLLTALPELGKQDFILLLSPEQKRTSTRERNLNHNLEIQRESGLARQGSPRSLTAK